MIQVKRRETYRDQEVLQWIDKKSHEIEYFVEDRTIIKQTWINIGKDTLHEDKHCIYQCKREKEENPHYYNFVFLCQIALAIHISIHLCILFIANKKGKNLDKKYVNKDISDQF